MNSLLDFYKVEVVPFLSQEFGYSNIHQIPTVEKIVLNMGLGEAVQNPKVIDIAVEQMSLIAGQKAVVTRAKKSIASFKIRAGMPIGCRVTLRSQKMWAFLERLLVVALPRVRDFRGLSASSFDGLGNYTLGIKEQLVFPEISFDQVDKVRGLSICVATSAASDEEARALLFKLGFPFRD